MRSIHHPLALVALILGFLPALRGNITLAVDVQTTPTPSVTMSWNSQGSNTVQIVRRPLGQLGIDTWTELSSNATSPFVDTTVVDGESYEYSVRSLTSTGYSNRLAHFVATINAPLEDERGAVLLVVEDTWTSELERELKLLELNLAADGWVVERLEWNREGQNNGADLRAAIQAAAANNPAINSLFIFGAVEMVKSGWLAPDGHAAHPHETDLFYGDLDGQWNDTLNSGNYTAGDGTYDPSYYPSAMELRTGRVTFHSLSAFKKNEVEYLRDYIHKEHAYRNGHRDVTYQNFVGDEFYLWASNASLKPMVGAGNWNSSGSLDQIIGEESYLVAFGNRTGSWDAARDGFQKAIFTACFRSHIQEWWSSNNNMRGMLTQPDWGLTAVWGGRPAWYFHKLAAGKPIGLSVIETQNDLLNPYSTYIDGKQVQARDYEFRSDESPVNYVSTNLMGDPTVRVSHVEPVGNLSLERLDSSNVRLSWNASPAADLIGYHVYASADRLGPYTRLTANPITDTSYDAPAASGGDVWLQVRAVADVTVPTGVYADQSHGRFALAYADGSVNTPPVAEDFTVTGKMNTPIAFTFPGTDADGDVLTPVFVDNPDSGQIRWWQGKPFYVSKRDETGTDTATYVLFDGVTVSEPATITFIASEFGESLVGWDFPDGSAAPQNPTYLHPQITSTAISGGPGTDMLSSWPGTDALTSRSIGATLDPASNYFQWTVTPENGARMSLNRINLGICGNGGDNIEYELRVSDDNFTSYEVVPMRLGSVIGRGYGGNVGILDTGDASGVSVLQDQDQAVQFRLHFWHTGGSSTVGLGKITDPVYYDAIEDVSLMGTVTSASGAPVILLTETDILVPEEGATTVNVSLSAPPASPVTLTVAQDSGDADLTLSSGATLEFDASNWNLPQSIEFSAAYDADVSGGTAVFSISGSELETVQLNVTELDAAQPPVAAPDSYEVAVDTPLSVAAPGVLANDTDANNEALTAVLVSGVTHGILTLDADGSLTYDPIPGFEGVDSFSYYADDGTLQSETVEVTLGISSTTLGLSVFGTVGQYTPEDFDSGQTGNATTTLLGGRQLTITGNGWFCVDLTSVTVNADTVLSLDFTNPIEGEIHGVGLDTDKAISPQYAVQFSGSQDWADHNLNDYDAERPATKHYEIPIGEYYTGTFRYLFFIHDHDDGASNSVATYANVRLYTPTAHTTWGDAMGLDVLGAYNLEDDANGDGKPNAYHFGLAGNPLSGNHSQNSKMSAVTQEDADHRYLTITAPFRLGATFSGSPMTSAPVDGIIYTIYGDRDLAAPLGDLAVVEVTPALDADLPALEDLDETPGADWEYRTFRLTDPTDTKAAGFLWIGVSEAP